MRLLLSTFLCFVSAKTLASTTTLAAVDVSVLLPLPKAHEFSLSLSPGHVGRQGALIPEKVYRFLPSLVVGSSPFEIYRHNLKLIALRLDPCFMEGRGNSQCRPQLRLVWQPLTRKPSSSFTTEDAAVHSFYEFAPQQWKLLLRDWKVLLSGVPGPLGIHPRMRQQGYEGRYWQNLKALLLHHCGEKNLVRLSAMTIAGNEQVWSFSGFDVKPQGVRPIQIPQLNVPNKLAATSQLAALDISSLDRFFGGMNPEPSGNLKFLMVVQNSQNARARFRPADFQNVLETVNAFENPRLHNPGTLDCVSCHMANSVRRWTEINFVPETFPTFSKNKYPGPWWQPMVRHQLRVNQFRSFGYFGDEPVISQRVINETAETLRILSTTRR